MKKILLVGFSTLFCAFLITNCGNDAKEKAQAKEKSCGKTTCVVPPLDEKADENLKATLEKINGKWDLLSIRQRYTATNQETYFTAKQMGPVRTFCFGNTGGIVLSMGKESTCNYCYTLEKTPENGVKMVIDTVGLSSFCRGQIDGGTIEFSANSLVINMNERLITKRYLLYRKK